MSAPWDPQDRGDAKIVSTSLVQAVAAHLRGEIVRGALRPGQSVTIRKLAAEFGISHTPIREAVRQLATEGFLHTSPDREAVVAPLSVEDAQELFELRAAIETLTMKDAIARHTPESIDAVHSAATAMTIALEKAEIDEYWQAHSRFLVALLSPGLTPWRLRMLRLLWQASERYYRIYVAEQPGVKELMEEHETMVNLLVARDAEGLVRCLHDHLLEDVRTIEREMGRFDHGVRDGSSTSAPKKDGA